MDTWINIITDETDRIRSESKTLRSCGVRARTVFSPLVGHRNLQIRAEDIRQARGIAKEYGLYLTSFGLRMLAGWQKNIIRRIAR